MTDFKEVRTTAHEKGTRGRATTYKLTQLVWLLIGLLEGALGLRFIFKLIGANPANAFAAFLYKLTDLFLAPFANLAGSPSAGNMVLEISTLLAMMIYGLIGWGLERLVYVLFYRPRGTVSTRQTVVAARTPPPQADVENQQVSENEEIES